MRPDDIDAHVHVGLWTNWSRGAVMGSTLTLTRVHGNLLIAFTASFIGFVSIKFWHIACIACHRVYSTYVRTAGWTWHQQRQVVLRNSASPESAIVSMLSLISAWWRQGGLARSKIMGKMSPVLFLAIATWLMFTVAGGFSAKIASAVEDHVLLKGVDCKAPVLPKDVDSTIEYLSELSSATSNAVDYARQCYPDNASGLVDCGRFTNSTIRWHIDKNSTCPFEDSICYAESIRLDTGHVDSAKVLGLNLPPDQAMSIRYVLECAPLRTEGFTSSLTTNDTTLVRYHYGRVAPSDRISNYTYDYTLQARDVRSQYESLFDPGALGYSGNQFKVAHTTSFVNLGKPYNLPGAWIPRAELVRDDADTSIVFLSGNGVLFGLSFTDAWYRGTVLAGGISDVGSDGFYYRGVYQPEEAASPLGCVEQYQVCNSGNTNGGSPSPERCGPLSGFFDAFGDAAPKFNSTRNTIIKSFDINNPWATQDYKYIPSGNRDATRLWWLGTSMSFYSINFRGPIGLLGAGALSSHSCQYQSVQYDVPRGDGDDGKPMWQLDVINFYTSVLASLQSTFVSFPLGAFATNKASDRWRLPIPDNATDLQAICDSQMARSSKYTSFSMFGLCFTYGLGIIIVVVSAALESVLNHLTERWSEEGFKKRTKGYNNWYVEWTAHSALQLHRLAQEAAGYGPWSKCDEKVPVTDVEARLGLLDHAQDGEHPMIVRPGEAAEEDSSRQVDMGKDAGEGREETSSGSQDTFSVRGENEIRPPEDAGRDR